MKTRFNFSAAPSVLTHVVVLALGLGVAACDSATGPSLSRHAEPRESATPVSPQPAVTYFGEEYAAAQRLLSTAPVEPMAPTF